jgi:predicted Zn finger-like uncharacterized protein
MKIVCDACQAKYSISDDKVQGKVFKIRCKKCSNIIVVRGGASVEPVQQPPPEKDTRVYDYGYEGNDHPPAGDEAVWHVVINQDQVGPMTADEVQRRFKGGELDAETYIWREGFADWLPLAQVDTFAGLLSAGPAAARSSGSEAVASMFGGDDPGPAHSDPGDLFAASASAARQDDDGGDLFGNKPAASSVQPAAARMRGERNENSVLFSLNNLAQLASDKPAPAPAPRSAMAVGSTPGAAGGEGSGLIDIRSMASAYLGAPSGAPKPATAGIGSIDDLPVFGGGGFTEPAVIVPIAARAGTNKLLYALIGSVGLLAVAAVVVVILLITGSKSNDNKPGAQVAQAGATDGKPAGDSRGASTQPDTDGKAAGSSAGSAPAASSTPGAAGSDEARPTKVAAAETEPRHPATVVQPHKAAPAAASSPPKAVPKTPEKASPPPPKETPTKVEKPDKSDSGGCDEVSCVLSSYEGACCAKFRKGGKAPAPSSGGAAPAAPKGDAPESLDRAMISDGVAKVKTRAQACGDKSPAKGQVKVSVKVSPDGHVVNVQVKNTPDQALANCVVGVMQTAKFARTQSGGSFSYPFQF